MTVLLMLVACKDDLQILPENNYSFSGEMVVAEVEVQPETELTFDWSGLTTDLRQRPFDGTVDEVAALSVSGEVSDFLERAITNTLLMEDTAKAFLYSPEATETAVQSGQLEIIGSYLETSDLTAGTAWMAAITDLPDGRQDLLMSKIVRPTEGSTNTVVAFEDGDAELVYEVDMSSPPVQLPEGAPKKGLVLRWDAVKKDVHGEPLDPLYTDELLIARYDVSSVEEVEASFLQLDTAAAELYRLYVYSETDADLLEAEDADGKTFGGFTKDGVWLVGLSDTTALSPVPLVLAVVEVQ